MEQQLPKIRIRYNGMLDKVFLFYCQNNPEFKQLGWNDWTPPNKDEILKRVHDYKNAWRENEEKVLNALSSILELNFINPIIDIHIVSGNPRQIGDPIIIKSGFTPDEFVVTLTHELIHYICSINNVEELDEYLEKPNANETSLTRRHIIVFAALTYLNKEILKDESGLTLARTASEKHRTSEYTRAWDIVNSLGYKKILALFRENKNGKTKELR